MIDIASALSILCSRTRNLQTGQGLRLSTFKKDRHLTIVRLQTGQLQALRNGFKIEEQIIDEEKLKKLMKRWIKKEFPRSKNAHLTTVTAENAKSR